MSCTRSQGISQQTQRNSLHDVIPGAVFWRTANNEQPKCDISLCGSVATGCRRLKRDQSAADQATAALTGTSCNESANS